MALLKPESQEKAQEKLHLSNIIKINAIRNFKEQVEDSTVKKKHGQTNGDIQENKLGPHKLSAEQIKGIYNLMDKRQKAIAKKDLPLGTYVKQLERMLDEGYQVEYLDLDDVKKKQYEFEFNDADMVDLTEERRKANRFMSRFKEGFSSLMRNKIEKVKHEKLVKRQIKKQISLGVERKLKRAAMQMGRIFIGKRAYEDDDAVSSESEGEMKRIPVYEVVNFSKHYKEIKDDYMKEKK